MVDLSAMELLDIWEEGRHQAPVWRALSLLAAAFPEHEAEALAVMSVGQRDGKLLALRKTLFGSEVTSVATCPACEERVELTIDLAQIKASDEATDEGEILDGPFLVRFRPPNSQDLLAVGEDYGNEGRQLLLQRCLLRIEQDGETATMTDLPASLVERIVEQMAALDPQAVVRLELTCAACEEAWPATFDIVSFLWDEIEAWARRTLHEVHLLASAYGWREAEILGLSARRRRAYIEMIADL